MPESSLYFSAINREVFFITSSFHNGILHNPILTSEVQYYLIITILLLTSLLLVTRQAEEDRILHIWHIFIMLIFMQLSCLFVEGLIIPLIDHYQMIELSLIKQFLPKLHEDQIADNSFFGLSIFNITFWGFYSVKFASKKHIPLITLLTCALLITLGSSGTYLIGYMLILTVLAWLITTTISFQPIQYTTSRFLRKILHR
jgi:hypothetical protein